MKNRDLLNKIIFYFENSCTRTHKKTDEVLVGKVRDFLSQFKPQKIWEEKGIINKRLKVNAYPDFVMISDGKLIACEVEKTNVTGKFDLFDGITLFDEIWFFTDIPVEKDWLHYKLENKLKVKQRFFGLNKESQITEIEDIVSSYRTH